ncbi:putative phosphoesterase [Halorubrum alkaliphilum]|uniref:Phosphoesterase n=1 Tax=Halorubrum alkaliphilum TaxID=261290 RepID=A0A8T4GGV5_9EURY|nr:metallophosphoesterase [Halorubrum alkaliphilum]MBP1922959.1 putative phosphoesterase [Halorubrum alkaliphilum]
MLVVLSDTHSTDDPRLRGRTREAVHEADLVVHAGDFYHESVLDGFEAATDRLRAVFGNNDGATIRDRIPEVRTVEYEGVRFAVTHRHRSGDTGLVMLGRGRDADAVICGHSHRPRFDDSTDLPILNPGSHAQPRGNRPAHAELEGDDDGLAGRLVTPDGEVFERFRIEF